MLLEKDVTEANLADTLGQLAGDPARRQEMAMAMRRLAYPLAAEEIIDVCLQLTNSGR